MALVNIYIGIFVADRIFGVALWVKIVYGVVCGIIVCEAFVLDFVFIHRRRNRNRDYVVKN